MILVIVGSALSIASFGLGYVEPLTGKPSAITEFYPFFHWRLYGDPKGANGAVTYRLYTRDSRSGPWQRHTITDRKGWSRYRYSFFLEKQVRALLREAGIGQDQDVPTPLDASDFPMEQQIFTAFVESVIGYRPVQIKVVQESFYPLTILSDSTAYDTTTVAHIIR